ncbi:TetR/AcrR family transcriptional regulator [Pseudomonas vancouverensis]|uniref:TetR/AcrR family transcriptional regulator n=1 Tax=Pseudomonas vancouverensis TaxID=95300 RepID=A0A1H2NM13_PSEVA|nr:TetR/AcrR family transcriptional regulator [Pseudomonas vancouverensis]KAB0495214.1 TetR/AcrR family transcriptional regulator [Pseudomonas vancouverensis]TDB57025.1 TetR/AcrR family transcriptional regulator [Pseudomonas vancouverensis]SDV06115.1 transcriptional regulator, TetR family [Pseudomonas vancouverensis]
MPRVSRKQAELNRETIVDAATRLFRERGLHGISVVDVMAAAGLTHGGFYGHFESKEALAQEASGRAFEQAAQRWQERATGREDKTAARRDVIELYLSNESRDKPGESCPVVAFAGDMCHEAADSGLHQTYLHGLNNLLDSLASLQESDDAAANRQQALVQYSLMFGALMLARATRGDPLSDELLETARDALLKPPAPRK